MTSLRALALASLVGISLTSIASAADLMVTHDEPAAVPPAGPAFYLGVLGGYGAASGDLTDIVLISDPNPDEIALEGYLLGLQAGVDLPLADHFVLGVVGDVSWTNITGASCVEGGGCGLGDDDDDDDSYLTPTIDWLATLRGRVGLDLGGAVIYATAGLAAAGVSIGVNDISTGVDAAGGADHFGYTAGIGLDVKVADAVTAGLEYLYVDLGKADYSFTSPGDLDLGTSAVTANIFRASLKMHF